MGHVSRNHKMWKKDWGRSAMSFPITHYLTGRSWVGGAFAGFAVPPRQTEAPPPGCSQTSDFSFFSQNPLLFIWYAWRCFRQHVMMSEETFPQVCESSSPTASPVLSLTVSSRCLPWLSCFALLFPLQRWKSEYRRYVAKDMWTIGANLGVWTLMPMHNEESINQFSVSGCFPLCLISFSLLLFVWFRLLIHRATRHSHLPSLPQPHHRCVSGFCVRALYVCAKALLYEYMCSHCISLGMCWCSTVYGP